MNLRIFLACPIRMDVLEVESLKHSLWSVFDHDETIEITTSKDFFADTFTQCGNWDNWIQKVIKGRDYQTQQDLFQVYVATQYELGRATAAIMEGALGRKKPVLHFTEGKLLSVASIGCSDNENWQAGWFLTYDTGQATLPLTHGNNRQKEIKNAGNQ